MKINYKLFSIQGILFLFSIELFSAIIIWTGLIPDIYSRSGVKSPKNIIYQGLNWRTENQDWGAWHKKNSYSRHIKSCFDVEYESNDIGARDTDNYIKDFPKDSIVALGDSFVEGYGLNHADTFTVQLQEKIRKKVFNLGSAYNFGPLQYYLVYKNLGENLSHSTVIVLFLPSNDFTDNDYENLKSSEDKRYRPYFTFNPESKEYEVIYPPNAIKKTNIGRSKFRNFLKAYSLKFHVGRLYNNIQMIRIYKVPRKNILSKNDFSNHNKSLSFNKGTIFQQDAAVHYLNKIYQLAKERGVKKFIILSIPRKKDFELFEKNEIYVSNKWEDELTRIDKNNKDYYYINGFEIIKNKPLGFYKKLFHSCDGHWSKTGASEYSNLIYENLILK